MAVPFSILVGQGKEVRTLHHVRRHISGRPDYGRLVHRPKGLVCAEEGTTIGEICQCVVGGFEQTELRALIVTSTPDPEIPFLFNTAVFLF